MLRRLRLATTTLILVALAAACTSGPPPAPEGSIVVEATRDDQETLEREFQDYLIRTEIHADTYAQGPDALGDALDHKTTVRMELESRLLAVRDASTYGSETHAWASLRLAQINLNMACELLLQEMPAGISDEEALEIRRVFVEITEPSMQQTRQRALDASNTATAAAEDAAGIVNAFAAHTDPATLCSSIRPLWAAP